MIRDYGWEGNHGEVRKYSDERSLLMVLNERKVLETVEPHSESLDGFKKQK